MDAISQIEHEGYSVTLNVDKIQLKRKAGFVPDVKKVNLLLDEIRAHKAEAMVYLKIRERLVWCPYKGQPRRVSWPVCEWHSAEKDPECAGCEPQERILH